MFSRQEFVAITKVVFAELAGRITEQLQRLRNTNVPGLQTLRSSRVGWNEKAGTPRRDALRSQ